MIRIKIDSNDDLEIRSVNSHTYVLFDCRYPLLLTPKICKVLT